MIKPNPSSGHSIIMLNSQAVRLLIREISTGRLVEQIELTPQNGGSEYCLEIDSKGTFSVQQLNAAGQVVTHDIWVLQ